MFELVAGSWTEVDQLSGSDSVLGDFFAQDVDADANGDTLVCSARLRDLPAWNFGQPSCCCPGLPNCGQMDTGCTNSPGRGSLLSVCDSGSLVCTRSAQAKFAGLREIPAARA